MKFQFKPKKLTNAKSTAPIEVRNLSIADRQLLQMYKKQIKLKKVVTVYKRKFVRKKYKILHNYKQMWLKQKNILN